MKVLFIIPPEETYIGASAHASVEREREPRPRLGILYVATYLQKFRPDIPIEVIDCSSCDIGYVELEEIVRSEKPDIVGLSALTFNYLDVLKTTMLIKTINPSIKVCIGGIHPTFYPKETLMQESVDYVVIGEGELTFLELLLCLEQKESLRDVKGLGFEENGHVIINEPRELINKLDNLPFPNYNLVDINRYSHVLGIGSITLSIQTSRGCPFACAFCDIRKTKYRYRSAESVVAELQQWMNRGIRSFFFVDDNFVLLRDRVIKICKMIIERGWNIDFKISSRADTLDEEMMGYLKRAGCSRLSLGVESCYQKYLDCIDKGILAERTIDTIEKAHKVGLPIFAYVMIGFPEETWEEMVEELRFLKQLRVEYASFSLLTPYPKTYLYRRELERGILLRDTWQEFAEDPDPNFQAPLVNTVYNQKQLREFQHRLTVRFYLTPSSMICRIQEIKNFDQLKRYSKIAYNILFKG